METTSPIASSLTWLEATLLGSAATVVAVIALAVFGLAMMWGHVDWRRGVRIVVGCFILFGAPLIAAGILSGAGSGLESAHVDFPAPPPPARRPGAVCWDCGPAPAPADPYAGASVHIQAERGLLQ